ncbi:MAG: hypothetical protein RR544_05030, partial [Oscillospiraceae bacterium]
MAISAKCTSPRHWLTTADAPNFSARKEDFMDYHQLHITAAKGRLLAMEAVHTAASGHIGGSLSAMDILVALYFHVMHIDPKNPADP